MARRNLRQAGGGCDEHEDAANQRSPDWDRVTWLWGPPASWWSTTTSSAPRPWPPPSKRAPTNITIMPPEAGRPVDELVGADRCCWRWAGVTSRRWRPGPRRCSATRSPRWCSTATTPTRPRWLRRCPRHHPDRAGAADGRPGCPGRESSSRAAPSFRARPRRRLRPRPLRRPWPASSIRRRGRSRCRPPRCSSARATSATCSPRAAVDRKQPDGEKPPLTGRCAR